MVRSNAGIGVRLGAMNFPVKPLIDEIKAIGILGFDYIEIAMDPPKAHWSDINRHFSAIRAALDKYQLDVVCHMPTFVCIADLTESIRSASLLEMLHSLHTAKMLGAKKVVLHPGISGGLFQYVKNRMIGYGLDSLKTIMAHANELEITICLENMPPHYHSFFMPDAFQAVFDDYPALQMTLDLGHAHIRDSKGRRGVTFLKRYSDRISHVHMSDNFGKCDDHLSLGDGSIDYPMIIHELKQLPYEKTITLEVFTKNRVDLMRSRDVLIRWLSTA